MTERRLGGEHRSRNIIVLLIRDYFVVPSSLSSFEAFIHIHIIDMI